MNKKKLINRRNLKLIEKYPDALGGEGIVNIKVGTIVRDFIDWNDVRVMVMRGPANFCAYLGVPLNDKLAGFHYDSIPLDVHGGLTYSQGHNKQYYNFKDKRGRKVRDPYPAGYWWYGWDYAHAGDEMFFYGKQHHLHKEISKKVIKDMQRTWPDYKGRQERVWTLGEVYEEASDKTYIFSQLRDFAKVAWQPRFVKWLMRKKRDWNMYYFRRWGMKKAMKWMTKERTKKNEK